MRVALAILALALGPGTNPAAAASQNWRAQDATITISLDPGHLESLGMRIVDIRETSDPAPERDLLMESPLHAFRMVPGTELEFRTSGGVFAEFEGAESVRLPFDGGFALQIRHPRTGELLSPAFLYDFDVVIDPEADRAIVEFHSKDPSAPTPFEVRSTSFRFAWNTGELSLRMGDIAVTREWARSLGREHLADQHFGTFDLHVTADPVLGEALAPEPVARRQPVSSMLPFLDVTLGELYGLTSFGRLGTYPSGQSGLSAATTSCNSGEVRVPWNAPMAETHPFIGISMFRLDADGVLEMIGRGWMKHGFAALSNDQCDLGCEGCGGSELCIGCSDTYSASLNANRYWLGPREEIDPYSGEWEACGSFFDEPDTPDPDCARGYFGNEPNGVNHRVVVHDEDLGNPGATYYYEGAYVVADDQDANNSIGWRECTTTWTGSNWSFGTLGGGLQPNIGPLMFTWGDHLTKKAVASDDGNVILGLKVDDNGDGTWHYEYALYNWQSARGIHSFSVPIAGVNVANVEFRDIDKDGGNEWALTNDGVNLTWSTDDYATDPEANALFYQMLFNFRFDADRPPVPDVLNLGIFKPGIGTTTLIQSHAPDGGATAVLESRPALDQLALMPNEPNPFSTGTTVRFSLGTSRDVKLSVLDVRGRLVQVLTEGSAPAGLTELRWDGRDLSGASVASGVYFFRLESGEEVRTVKGTMLN